MKQEHKSILNVQNVERKFGDEMILHLPPILNSINMNAIVDGLDMLLFNKAVKWNGNN